MNTEIIQKLRQNLDRVVRITSTEGEVMVAKLLFVSEEHQDVILDLISTNKPERYVRMGKPDFKGSYSLPFEYIASVTPDVGQ